MVSLMGEGSSSEKQNAAIAPELAREQAKHADTKAHLSMLTEAAEETLRVLGPHEGAHEGEWRPCLARLRDIVGLVRRG